jgi:hypothetical protein
MKIRKTKLLITAREIVKKSVNFFQRMLADSKSGDISSKRVIGVSGFIALTAMMFINALYPKSIAPSNELISAIEYIVIAALFSTSVDKFSPKHLDNQMSQDESTKQ